MNFNFFGHKKEAEPANPDAVAPAAAEPITEQPITPAAEAVTPPAVEASADFQVPTSAETQPTVSEEAVQKAMGSTAANLLNTTEAEANGTMDIAAPIETPAPTHVELDGIAAVSDDKYANMQPVAASEAMQANIAPVDQLDVEVADATTDIPTLQSEVQTAERAEASTIGVMDSVPELPTAADDAIVEGLNLPAAGQEDRDETPRMAEPVVTIESAPEPEPIVKTVIDMNNRMEDGKEVVTDADVQELISTTPESPTETDPNQQQ